MSATMDASTLPESPEDWVEFNEELRSESDVLLCPICEKELEDSLASHVRRTEDHPDLETFKEEYDGMPLISEGFSETMSEARQVDFGVYDWRRLNVVDRTVVDQRDWLMEVEESGLINEPAIFERIVELSNMRSRQRRPLKLGVASCLCLALNENGYDFITAKEVADRLGLDEVEVRREKRRHPESVSDLRTPEEVVRLKVDEIGDVNLNEIREELLSYPDEFRGGGRNPRTIAALATWRVVDWITQYRAGKIFGVTDMAIRNTRDDLETREGYDSE